MGSIMDPQGGFAARDVVRAAGASVLGRIDDVERQVDALRRVLGFEMRAFRGFTLNDSGVTVTPDADGFVQLWSKDSSISIDNEPTGGAHAINLETSGL